MDIKKNKIVSYLFGLSIPKSLFLLFTIFFLFSLLVTIPTYTHDFDEGWAADIGNHLANGKVLYKDISAPYGPVVFYIYAFLISFFGKQFFVFRIVGLLIIILQAYLTSKIVNLYTEKKSIIIGSALISLISLGLYQGCRITASTVAGLITLMIVFYHLSYINNKNRSLLVLIGGLFTLSLLTKHNVFAMDVLGNGIFMIFNAIILYKKEKSIDYKYFLIMIFSFIAFLIPYIIYIFPYYNIVINDTVFAISQYTSSDVTIPFPSPLDIANMNFLEILLSIFLYSIFPLIISGMIIYYREIQETNKINAGLIFIFITTVLHYFEVFPLSDYSHYARATILYAPCIGLLSYLAYKQKNRIATFLVLFALSLHLYSSGIILYSSLKVLSVQPISNLPYHKYLRKIPDEFTISKILNEIRELESDKILIIGHGNVYYYLSDKLSYSRYTIITHHYLNDRTQEEVIEEINNYNISYIIETPSVRSINKPDKRFINSNSTIEELKTLNEYIKKHFVFEKNIDGYNFWSK